jgi:beta-mannosidase
MRARYDLSTLAWTLTGWHPHYWRATLSMETGMRLACDEGPHPAKAPGSVQQALREAGVLPDWNEGLHSRECEWVENRHWAFQTTVPDDWMAQPGRLWLDCQGLDYRGVILVNGQEAARFDNGFVPYRIEITPYRLPSANTLTVVFTELPRALGQVGFTSKITEWKARFNYIWDWVPRLVQVGISDMITLEVEHQDVISALDLYTDYDDEEGRGTIVPSAKIDVYHAAEIEVELADDTGTVFIQRSLAAPTYTQPLSELLVQPWQPNGNGDQPLYRFTMRLLSNKGEVLDEVTRRIGFKQVRWLPCAGAPSGAAPWVCEVNGAPTFLQGVNWTPIRPNYADVTEADYRQRLTWYRDMGCNLLRVWGGGPLERECFYDLCDELGLMVWQEFPLSSSGLDNWPPEGNAAIAALTAIARSYIRRRQHHPSLLMWCGGNELQGAPDGGKVGIGQPADLSHPLLSALCDVVAQHDPTRRFVPTSASGPRFTADAGDFGKGLHHDVHGPWNVQSMLEAECYPYWDHDDALFRSEAGMPGSSSAALIRQYGGALALPGDHDNPFWLHTGGWWVQWPQYLAEDGDPDDLEAFVMWSQQRQADALAYAARACKRRFPGCGGFLVWMGHDAYPCPSNTAILDFTGEPKPAALALKEIFTAPVAALAP